MTIDYALQLGLQALRAGRFDIALERFRQGLCSGKKDPQILLNCATACCGMHDWQQVSRYCRQALKLDGSNPRAHYILAEALRRQSKQVSAIKHYKRALAVDGGLHEARLGLALSLKSAGNNKAAEQQLNILLYHQPDHVGALNNLANLYSEQKNWRQAQRVYRLAVDRNPTLLDAWVNLGIACEQLGELDRAFHAYQQACALRPQAWPEFDRQIEMDAVSGLFRKARTNQIAMELRRGNFAQGWRYYDFRLTAPDHPFQGSRPPGRLWRGESLRGKTIYLMREQGLGDEICYASYIDDILARAGHCVIECQPKLAELFAASFPRATLVVVDPGATTDYDQQAAINDAGIDYYSPIPSLAAFLRTSIEQFRASAYLQVDSKLVDRWKHTLAQCSKPVKIGISWRGGRLNTHAAERSLTVDELVTTLLDDRVQLVNLQYTDTHKERELVKNKQGVVIDHFQQAIDDYDHTAALVQALDLVISVDTSLAHLAGALGQKVWCILPAFADWRWQMDREDTLWYPHMRLYRHSLGVDRAMLLEKLHADLKQFLASHESVT